MLGIFQLYKNVWGHLSNTEVALLSGNFFKCNILEAKAGCSRIFKQEYCAPVYKPKIYVRNYNVAKNVNIRFTAAQKNIHFCITINVTAMLNSYNIL